eukprot:GEMP01019830.1.p1 GENE.GEMP01019830.1~~GEMP01019830.1.p1  ORF type:complete len:593 (+),score=134.84 GEMP01019830.1:36-1781(+)
MLWTPRIAPNWPTNKACTGTTSWSDRPSISAGFTILPNATPPISTMYVVNNAQCQELQCACPIPFGANVQSKESIMMPRINGSRASVDQTTKMPAVCLDDHTDPAFGDVVSPIALRRDEIRGKVGEPKIKETEDERVPTPGRDIGPVQRALSKQRDEIAELKTKARHMEKKNIESTRELNKRTNELAKAQHRIILLEQDLERSSVLRNQLESQLKHEHFQLVSAQLHVKEIQRKFDMQEEERLPVPFEPGLLDRLQSLRSELDKACGALAEMQKGEKVANESDLAEDSEMIDLGGESVFQMPSMNTFGTYDVYNDELTYNDPIDTFMTNGTSSITSPRESRSELPTPISSPNRVSMRPMEQDTSRRTSSISSAVMDPLSGFVRSMCSNNSIDAVSEDVKKTPRRSLQFRDMASTPGSSQPTPRRMGSDTQLPSPASESVGTGSRKSSMNTGTYKLEKITLRDLSEIKALKRPPESIRLLMEVCCLLMNVDPDRKRDGTTPGKFVNDYWEPARRVILSDPFFLSKLRLVDPDEISKDVWSKIRDYFDHRAFTAERVRKCSKPAASLFDWIKGLCVESRTPPG